MIKKNNIIDKQVNSKKRIVEHGEVYTSEREVNAMLDLVKQETERIDSRFLEPACGTGNFLVEILHRKLNIVVNRYRKNQLEFERYTILAVSSIYGIDILEDNIIECRERLFQVFDKSYTKIYNEKAKNKYRKSIRFILSLNIIWGDALTLKKIEKRSEAVVFSEWSLVRGSMIKRRDYSFHELLTHNENQLMAISSDTGRNVFIPEPLKEYPITHLLRISDV